MTSRPLRPGSKIQDHYALATFWLGLNTEFTADRWCELLTMNGRPMDLAPMRALVNRGYAERVKQGVYKLKEKKA